jgi:hypothetical protein
MLNYSNLSPAGQQHRIMEIGEMIGDHPVRFRIDHDTSYAKQSSAVAEVWSPADLAWHQLATYLYSEWADYRGRDSADGPTEGMSMAYDELSARAQAILG